MEGDICQPLPRDPPPEVALARSREPGSRQRDAAGSCPPVHLPEAGSSLCHAWSEGSGPGCAPYGEPAAPCLRGSHLEGTPICWRPPVAFFQLQPVCWAHFSPEVAQTNGSIIPEDDSLEAAGAGDARIE